MCCDSSFGRGLTIAGLGVAYLVAIPLAPVVGIVGALIGIPVNVYRYCRYSQAKQREVELVRSLANSVLKIGQGYIVNGKNYMDPQTKFTTKGELDALLAHQKAKKEYVDYTAQLNTISREVKKRGKAVEQFGALNGAFLLSMIPVIGLALAVLFATTGNIGSANSNGDDIYRNVRAPGEIPNILQAHGEPGMYINEKEALAYHIAQAKKIVETTDTVYNLAWVLAKSPQSVKNNLYPVQAIISQFVLGKDNACKFTVKGERIAPLKAADIASIQADAKQGLARPATYPSDATSKQGDAQQRLAPPAAATAYAAGNRAVHNFLHRRFGHAFAQRALPAAQPAQPTAAPVPETAAAGTAAPTPPANQ